MSENQGDDPTVNLKPNPIIAKLSALSEPGVGTGGPEKIVPLMGYLGARGDGDKIKLYLQLDLGAYYLISTRDILYAMAVDGNDPVKPTKLMVRASANIELVQSCEASFLTGNITASCSTVAADCIIPPAAAALTATPVTTGPHCHLTGMVTVPVTTGPHCHLTTVPGRPTGPHCETSIDCRR